MTDDLRDREIASLFALDDAPGPARPLSAAKAAALVDAAIAASTTTPSLAKPKPPVRVLLIAAVVTGIAGVAAAAIWIGTRPQTTPPPPPATHEVPLPQPLAAPTIVPDANIAPVVVPPADAAPVAELDLAPDLMLPTHTDRPDADELLARANALRAKKQWRDADRLYRKVAATYPHTVSAHVADVASGTLHLEHLGDPRGALHSYQAALAARANGPLDEEARYGIAEADRALHDTRGEAAALRAFLTAHPRSPLAAKATARLTELAPLP